MTTDVCKEHSGCEARITHLETQYTDINERVRGVEMIVYKASGITGIIMGVVFTVIQHYWK